MSHDRRRNKFDDDPCTLATPPPKAGRRRAPRPALDRSVWRGALTAFAGIAMAGGVVVTTLGPLVDSVLFGR